MSYSKRERGEYIRSQLMDIALRGTDKETLNAKLFADVYDLISGIDHAGNPKGSERHDISAKDVARHSIYKEVIRRWREVLRAKTRRLESRSL